MSLQALKPKPPAYPKEIKSLGDHIRTKRLDLGLLQKQVAEQIGVDETTIWNWEGQRSHPALIFMPAIICFLGYDPLPETKTLAGQLTRYRVSRGLTQKEFAKQLGIDTCILARWERGDRTPTGLHRKLVEKLLAEAFPVS